jgi:hypothetical protein
MLAEPLPRNAHLFWLHCSGFQASCHISYKSYGRTLRHTDSHRQQGDLVSLFIFFQNKESRLRKQKHTKELYKIMKLAIIDKENIMSET